MKTIKKSFGTKAGTNLIIIAVIVWCIYLIVLGLKSLWNLF